jgi:L-2-hydroxyglutarate oxidase LhgO
LICQRPTILTDHGDPEIAASEILVNCAGLSSLEVLDYFYKDHEMENYFINGHYFSSRLSSPVPHLLYPMPEVLGLGVHLTLDLNGQVKFGPDTQHIHEVNYRQEVDADVFYKKVALNFKIAGPESLCFDYAGIRPKVKSKRGGGQRLYIPHKKGSSFKWDGFAAWD